MIDLEALRTRLKTGNYDGADIMAAWISIDRLIEAEAVRDAAQDLYDNRLGWSDSRNPYAHPEFWERLEQALKDK